MNPGFGANLGSTVRPCSTKEKEKRGDGTRQDRDGDEKNGNRRQKGRGGLLKPSRVYLWNASTCRPPV